MDEGYIDYTRYLITAVSYKDLARLDYFLTVIFHFSEKVRTLCLASNATTLIMYDFMMRAFRSCADIVHTCFSHRADGSEIRYPHYVVR